MAEADGERQVVDDDSGNGAAVVCYRIAGSEPPEPESGKSVGVL